MNLLLGDPAARDIDVMAIQERINSHTDATHCPAACPFVPVWREANSRSCILVNKRLDPNRWEATVTSKDLCSVEITTDLEEIHIYSAYAPTPGSFAVRPEEYSNPFPGP